MRHSDELVRCLVDCDVAAMRRLSQHIAPHLPRASDLDTLKSIHITRTNMASLNFRLRAYSHRWLSERGLPSMLPDELKPRAERLYPTVADAVGIAVGGTSELSRAASPFIRSAMVDTVLDCYANGDRDPEIIKPRLAEARSAAVRKLLGR